MEKAIIRKEMKRRQRKRILRKVSFAVIVVLLLSLWWFNNYCATNGVPQWLIRGITAPLRKAGYRIEAKRVTFSFTKGLFIKELYYQGKKSGIQLYAPVLLIDFHPLKLFEGVSCPISLTVRDADAVLPVLPETGEEGKNDCLNFTNLNAEIRGMPGYFKVERASANIGNISVKMSGSVNNLLHIIAENVMSEYWEQNKAGKKWIKRKYPYGIMQMFPLEIRKKFMLSYHQLEMMEMKEPLNCNLRFHIDANDFKNCEITSEIELPEFQFKNLKIRGIKEQISLEKGILYLKEVSFDLGNGATLTAEGTYHDEKGVFSGKVKGNCYISDLMQFVESGLAEEIQNYVVFDNENKVNVNGILEHFSVSGNRYKGKIELSLPKIIVNGISMKNLKLAVSADDSNLYGEIRKAETESGEISGTFTISNTGEILCEIKGKSKLHTFQKALIEDAKKFIKDKISFSHPESPIEFSGKFRANTHRMNQYRGQVDIKYSHVSVNGVEIKDIEAALEFSPEQIHFSKITANSADGSKFSGMLLFDLKKKHITAKIVTSGIPQNLAKAFDTIWQTDSLMPLAKDISSIDKKGIAETDMVLFADYGRKPFYQISGNVVMRNPTYMGIPFQYGAARFITDSDDRLIIPDLILKAKNGTMRLESIYYLKEKKTGDETLYFNLKSSIAGNDLLTIFGDGYKPELVDFPNPIDVEAKGIINYTDQKKTQIRADVKNGTCTLAGAKVENINAVLHLENEEVFFKDADMRVCKGNCKADFRYNFSTEKGSFKQELEGADLREAMKEFQISKFIPAGTGNGKLAFNSNGTFEYAKNNILLINGKGTLTLDGNELWDVPILKDFMKYISSAWSVLSKGTGVTSFTCDISFKGEKAVIEKVKTNGNIISVDANGEIFWNTGDYDITVQAILFQSALPFGAASTILKPVSMMMRKNFKGNHKFPSQTQKKEAPKNEKIKAGK